MTQMKLALPAATKSNIAAAVNEAHEAVKAAERSVVTNACECGRLLTEAKATTRHGEWAAWVADNCRFSLRTAQLYMKLADYVGDGDLAKAQRVADLSLREIQTLLADDSNETARAKREKAADHQRQVDEMSGHWLLSGPLERRAFVLALAVTGHIPFKVVERQLRWLKKNDGPPEEASIKSLENEGLHPKEAIAAFRRRDVAISIKETDLSKLLDLAGPPASALACVLAAKVRRSASAQ